jgi:hypothetical protein
MNSSNKKKYKDIFFEKKKSIVPRANYLKLEQTYNNAQKIVHGYFENLDDFEFYRTAITYNYHGYKLKEYLQEGKQNVIDGYREVDWDKYQKSLVLFFADKDYDDFITVDKVDSVNFFYTKWYSIENYLVTEEAFEVVLKNFFTHMTPQIIKLLLSLFNVAQKQFHVQIKSITRFILIFRRLKKELDLDKIIMPDFIVLNRMNYMEKKLVTENTYRQITRDPTVPHLQKSLVRSASIKEILVAKCKADAELINFTNILFSHKMLYDVKEPKIYVRGKYELWFFTELINTVENAVDQIYIEQRIDETTYPKPSKKIAVTNANAFHLIASKLSYPPELDSFLNVNFDKIQ